jgi:hypothetical protein
MTRTSQQKDQQGKQTRFIFDLSLDALGKVQLDGLFRAKRLDLIVRTLTPFSLPMQQDMRRIYSGDARRDQHHGRSFVPEQAGAMGDDYAGQ